MRKITVLLLIFISLWTASPVRAQVNNPFSNMNENGQFDQFNGQDPNKPDSATMQGTDRFVPIDVKSWRVDERLGYVIPADVDTLHHQFMNKHFTEGVNGEYNILGNTGTPRYSRIFANRKPWTQDVFADPYDFFLKNPGDFLFFNTKSPYTNITYDWCGDKRIGDDRLQFTLAVNPNKRLNIGVRIDYLYGRGYYNNQATAHFGGTAFSSYRGNHYQMHLVYSINHMKMQENGGIMDDNYITHPENMTQSVQSQDIPTVFEQTWNRQHINDFFFTHRYNVGFYRTEKLRNEADPHGKDSIRTVRTLVPVTSFIHTLRIQSNEHTYIAYQTPENYYLNTFIPGDSTYVDQRFLSVKNTVGIELLEGFNKWAKMGLTAFASYEMRRFRQPGKLANGSIIEEKTKDNIFSVGGRISKRQGKLLHYDVTGEIPLSGQELGAFNVTGNGDLNIPFLKKDTVRVDLKAFVRNQAIPYFWQHTHTKNFWWDLDLNKQLHTHIEGAFSLKRTRTTLRIAVDNVTNMLYFQRADQESGAAWLNNVTLNQKSGSVQVLMAQLSQGLSWKVLHWDNEITWQKSSDKDVLPLPDLNIYSNLYLAFRLFRVLDFEIGADARFFTQYYAYDYSPELGQYVNQDAARRIKIGSYPIVNAYINCNLKHMRFYIMMSHVSSGMGNRNMFLAPHYPINPRILKFGLSWNLYN